MAQQDTHSHSAAAANAPDDAAPGRLETVRRLVNTRDEEDGIEELSSPAAMRKWLRAHGLPDVPRPGAPDVERLTGLRESLRELMLANNGCSHDGSALDRLRDEAARVEVKVAFGPGGETALVPAGDGMDAVVAELLGIVHEAMSAGTWARMKACRSGTCEWGFYDRSRNRSGAWCSMAVCGNREKARSYRRRHGDGNSRT